MFLKLLYTFSYSVKSIYNIKSSVARANRVPVVFLVILKILMKNYFLKIL